jgi:hypothetical protein
VLASQIFYGVFLNNTETTPPRVTLCEVCSRIPLDQLLSKDGRNPNSVSFTIRTFSEAEARPHCALCKTCTDILRSLHQLGQRYGKWLSGEGECTFRIVPKACNRHPGQDRNPEWYSLRIAMKALIRPHAYLELSKPPNYRWKPTFLIQRTSIKLVQVRFGL